MSAPLERLPYRCKAAWLDGGKAQLRATAHLVAAKARFVESDEMGIVIILHIA
jgi:hypothetical protein